MSRSFNIAGRRVAPDDPRVVARAVLGVLLLMNVVAAGFAFKPWGASPEDLAREEQQLRAQLKELEARVSRTRTLAANVEKARTEGDKFLEQYTTDRRTTFSTIVSELAETATQAGIKQRACDINLEPIEGSETLSQMTVNCGYEANYPNLTKFVNLLDRSKRFLVIEQMVATPQQSGGALNVSLKLDSFVRSVS